MSCCSKPTQKMSQMNHTCLSPISTFSSGDGSVPSQQPWPVQAGQWEPTLAAPLLRQSHQTDGAGLGWDPEPDRVPAMSSRWFTQWLLTEGSPAAQLTSAGCRVSSPRQGGVAVGPGGGGGLGQMCVWERGLVHPGGLGAPTYPPSWSAAGSLQHVCGDGGLWNTLSLRASLKQQSLALLSLTMNLESHPPVLTLLGRSQTGAVCCHGSFDTNQNWHHIYFFL